VEGIQKSAIFKALHHLSPLGGSEKHRARQEKQKNLKTGPQPRPEAFRNPVLQQVEQQNHRHLNQKKTGIPPQIHETQVSGKIICQIDGQKDRQHPRFPGGDGGR